MRKIFTALSMFILFTSPVHAMDVVMTPEDSVECPSACPCCDDIIPNLKNNMEDFNEYIDDMKKYTEENYDFKKVRQNHTVRQDAVNRSQSSDRDTSRQGHSDYRDIAEKFKDKEASITEDHNDIDDSLDDMEQMAQDIIADIDKLKNCPCWAEVLECCGGVLCERFLSDRAQTAKDFLENKLPDLKKNNGLARNGAMAVVLSYSEDAQRVAKDAMKNLQKGFQDLWKFDPSIVKKIGDCCKKGKDECFEDTVAGDYALPLDWLTDSGSALIDFTGANNPTGDIGSIAVTNLTGKPMTFTVPAGSVLSTGDNTVQRMSVTEGIRGTVNPGETVNFPVHGVCMDSTLHPPPASTTSDISLPGLPDFSDLFSGLNLTPSSGSFWKDHGLDSLFGNLDDLKEEYGDKLGGLLVDALPFFGVTPDQIKQILEELEQDQQTDIDAQYDDILDHLWEELNTMGFSSEVFVDIALTEFLEDYLDDLYKFGLIPPTGLPIETERETLLQWLYWSVLDGFDEMDGENKIATEVEETGGSQTPEQIAQLNENLWGNVRLVKKKAKEDLTNAAGGSNTGAFKRKQNFYQLVLNWQSALSGLKNIVTLPEAHAQKSLSIEEQRVQTANAMRRFQTVKSSLINFTFDVENLVKNAVSMKIAKTNQSTAEFTRAQLAGLTQQIKAGRPTVNKETGMDQAYLQSVYAHTHQFVKKDGTFNSTWKDIKNDLGGVYKKWEAKYKKLLSKSRKSVKKGNHYLEKLDRDERKFFVVFSKVKLYTMILDSIYK